MDMQILLTLIAISIGVLLWRSFFPAYVSEKGKNLATLEDIAKITDEVEHVKILYTGQLKQLEHQNAILLEELRSRHQLRMAAVERRLDVHQHAFTLWRTLLSKVHADDVSHIVNDCQHWWDRNCLYLSPGAREAFNRAYFAAANHKSIIQDSSNPKEVKDNWATIMKAGPAIVAGVELPTLGEQEACDVTAKP